MNHEPSHDAARLAEAPKRVGAGAADHDDADHHHGHDHEGEWKLQLFAAGLCGALALIAHFWKDGPTLLIFAAAYLAGAWFTAQEVWERLQKRALDVHFLMLAVAVGAAAIGQWGEGATLLFLFALSGALEHYAMERTQREIKALFKAAPKTATILDPQGVEQTVPVADLIAGSRLIVKPGELFPVDAEVAKGETAADESNLTGEATPVDKHVGDSLLAGTLNLWGHVEAVALRPAQESALQKIIHLIRTAQRNKAPVQRFTDRFGTGYTYGVLGLTLVMFFVWWLMLGHEPWISQAGNVSSFYLAMTLLVVASPCALVLSIPSAILAAIAWGARRGILFRGGAAVEGLGEVQIVAMDKTGTLTTGELRVERVESFPPGREAEVARLAFSLDRLSQHPLGRAIVRYARREQIAPLEVTDFSSVTGMGLEATQGAAKVRLGRRSWVAPDRAPDEQGAAFGVSEVWLASSDPANVTGESGNLLGRILLRDDLRPEAPALIAALRRHGLEPIVLTGDRAASADFLRSQLKLDDVRGELKPNEKLSILEGFAHAGRKAAMIGDGVNDAPSLAAAHVGVAMGARGSDAALEQADVVLMHDRLENFLAAYQLSRRARAIIRQNLAISLGVIVILVTLALFQRIPLTVGVLGHEGSTLVVVLNSLRLLFTPKPAGVGGRLEARTTSAS